MAVWIETLSANRFFLVSWIVLRMGGAAYTVFVVAIIANIVMFVVRIVIVRSLIGLSLKPYFLKVVFPILLVAFVSIIPSYGMHYFFPKGFLFSCIIGFMSIVFTTFTIYSIGLDKVMQEKIKSATKNQFSKLVRNLNK